MLALAQTIGGVPMTPSLQSEISRQRVAARELLRVAADEGDEYLAIVASARLAELEDIARRHDIPERLRDRAS
jgi:hypothetical protein